MLMVDLEILYNCKIIYPDKSMNCYLYSKYMFIQRFLNDLRKMIKKRPTADYKLFSFLCK